jgi:cystathionine beta-lyase
MAGTLRRDGVHYPPRVAGAPIDPFGGVTIDWLRTRRGMKWSRHPADVVPAWIADADTAVCPPVRDAIEALLDRGDLAYPDDAWGPSIVDAFVARQARWHGWEPDPALVRLAPETIQVISLVIDRCTTTGEPVAVHTPTYPPILSELEALGRPLAALPWERDGAGWVTDVARVDAAADAGARLLVLVNPHNPTGRVWRRDELEALADVVRRRDLLVLADEIHAELTHDDRPHVPFASLGADVAARTLTLTAASKSFNLAGTKCVVAHVGTAPGFDPFRAVPATQLGEISNVGAVATIAAWQHGDEWLDAFRVAIDERRQQLDEALRRHLPEVIHSPPEATFLAWLDCRPLELPPEPATFFLDRARVALGAGPDFGPGGAGSVRVNLATTRDILDELVERMVTAVDLWRASS